MISKKHNYYMILCSTILTSATVALSLFVYVYNDAFGTQGLSDQGLKYEILLAQTATREIKEIKTIQQETSKEPKQKADFSKKEKVKKKVKKKPTQKKRDAKKQVFDRATIGKLNLIYARTLQSSIARNMVSPSVLQKTSTVFVRFRINGYGAIELLNIHTSSGNPTLDKLALLTVRISSPFGKPPVAIRHTDMTYIIPMIYEVQ